MILDELFSTFKEFMEMVPGVDSSLDFTLLNSSALSAKKQINVILTSSVWGACVNDLSLKQLLQMAMGNLTMAKEVPYDILRKRKAGIDVYKSEQEAVQRGYVDNYFNAMDSLISSLTENESWKKTTYCKILSSLEITDANTFDTFYPIDCSYLFFFRCIPLQKEVISLKIGDLKSQVAEKSDLNITDKMDRAIVLYTIALALRRFDILEFPPAIRNLFSETSTQRQGVNEQSRVVQLADDLSLQADQIILSLQTVVADDEGTDVETQTSFNEPNDKIYLLP